MAALQGLPAWAQQLSEKYYSRTIALFVLHRNLRDLVPWATDGKTRFLPLNRFLDEALFGSREIVLAYDRGGGISFSRPEAHADFRHALSGYDSFHGTNYSEGGLPRSSDGVLNILDSYLRVRILDGKKIALIIDFAETIAPAGEISSMSAEDRNSLVILKR